MYSLKYIEIYNKVSAAKEQEVPRNVVPKPKMVYDQTTPVPLSNNKTPKPKKSECCN